MGRVEQPQMSDHEFGNTELSLRIDIRGDTEKKVKKHLNTCYGNLNVITSRNSQAISFFLPSSLFFHFLISPYHPSFPHHISSLCFL